MNAISFFIGPGSEGVKEVLRHVSGDADGDVAANPDFKKMVGGMKPGYAGMSWADTRKEVANIVRQLQRNPMLLFLAGQFVSVTSMPSPEDFARYFDQTVSASYVEGGTYHSTALIAYPKEFVAAP